MKFLGPFTLSPLPEWERGRVRVKAANGRFYKKTLVDNWDRMRVEIKENL
jgi:hypothetical protein